MKFCIDGLFLTRGFGGQERYSYEILYELDKIIEQDEIELVIPESVDNIPDYKKIRVVKYGKHKGIIWEQFDFYRYLIKSGRKGVYLCNTWPIFRPDIATMHDAVMYAMPQIYTNLYGKFSVFYHKLLFGSAKKRAIRIFTISNYSKSELNKYLGIKLEDIEVVDCGWQHMKKIVADYSVFEKFHDLKKGDFYLSVSSRTPQKNFKWVVEAAKNNPKELFAIVGQKVGLTVDDETSAPENIMYLGKISDGEMKALMENCKALIHPAIYEGFGMTPLEAASVGAPIIISNRTCLPEIYGSAAHYIDADIPKIDLNEILKEKVSNIEEVLDRYSWKNNAERLYQILKGLGDK